MFSWDGIFCLVGWPMPPVVVLVYALSGVGNDKNGCQMIPRSPSFFNDAKWMPICYESHICI